MNLRRIAMGGADVVGPCIASHLHSRAAYVTVAHTGVQAPLAMNGRLRPLVNGFSAKNIRTGNLAAAIMGDDVDPVMRNSDPRR